MNESYRQFLSAGERAGMRYALAAPPYAATRAAGVQLANRAGASLEFKDHRDYQPGDDLRRIDWHVYARSDQLTIKLFREEVAPHLDLVIDGSRSMALEETAKLEAVLGMAAVFAVAADNAGFTHTTWLAGEVIRPVDNGTGPPSAWWGLGFDYTGTPGESFERLPPSWRSLGLRVFLSDLLYPGEPLRTLSHLSDSAVSVVVVQVLAGADVNPPERGNIRLLDSETDELQEVFIDATAERDYRDALARHQENWHRDCRQVGAVMNTLVAEELLGGWNLEALVASEVLEVA